MKTYGFLDFVNGLSTFALIKPDAFEMRSQIIKLIYDNGFDVVQSKMGLLRDRDLRFLYYEHVEKPYYHDLCKFMSSGPCVLLMLVKEDAVMNWRDLMGSTDSSEASPASIRGLFGDPTTIRRNAVHGSDSTTSARAELSYFFPERSI